MLEEVFRTRKRNIYWGWAIGLITLIWLWFFVVTIWMGFLGASELINFNLKDGLIEVGTAFYLAFYLRSISPVVTYRHARTYYLTCIQEDYLDS